MIVHASTFSSPFIPFGNVILLLVIWLLKREESPFVDHHGKAALNFQLSLIIYMIAIVIWGFIFIGLLVPLLFVSFGSLVPQVSVGIGLLILQVVYTIIAIIKASGGKEMKYPLTMPFFK